MMDEDKDKNNPLESQVEQAFQEHVHEELTGCFGGLSKFDLKALKQGASNLVKNILFGRKACGRTLQKKCEKILNEPVLQVQTLFSKLFLMRVDEGFVPNPIRVSMYPFILTLPQMLYVYGNVELGKIQHYVGDIRGGNELRKVHAQYELYEQAFGDPIFDEALKTEDFRTLLKSIILATRKLSCRINPREVIEHLYNSPTGKEFLPFALIQYLENEKTNKASTALKNSNRSGSTINPEKHAITKEACQKAWEKIQEEQILGLNVEKFSDIASSFLKPGQSLVTTVSREFYRSEVSKVYKAGVGRKG